LAVLALSRFIDTSLTIAIKSGAIPDWPRNNYDLMLWIVTNCATQYWISCSADVNNVDVNKFYVHWAQLTKPDKQLIAIWHKQHAEGRVW
jgi:hypothetical protein